MKFQIKFFFFSIFQSEAKVNSIGPYYLFISITIHVHFFSFLTNNLSDLFFLDLDSSVIKKPSTWVVCMLLGKYFSPSFFCLINLLIFFSKGISDSALPYKRTVPSVSNQKRENENFQ